MKRVFQMIGHSTWLGIKMVIAEGIKSKWKISDLENHGKLAICVSDRIFWSFFLQVLIQFDQLL